MGAYVTSLGSDVQNDVALGLYGGTGPGALLRRVTGLGQVTVASSGVASTDIWTGAGSYPWMTGATSLEALSSSASDTAAGVGAQSITVTGLDTGFNEISETKATNGVTPVAFSTQFYRINAVSVTTAGSSLTNVGTITIRDAGGGTTRAILPISSVPELTPGVSKQSQWTTPIGHTLLIFDIDLQINSSAGGGGTSKGADALFYFKGSAANAPRRLPRALTTVDVTSKNLDPKTRISVPAGTDFGLRCSYTSAAGIILSGSWEGILVRRIP